MTRAGCTLHAHCFLSVLQRVWTSYPLGTSRLTLPCLHGSLRSDRAMLQVGGLTAPPVSRSYPHHILYDQNQNRNRNLRIHHIVPPEHSHLSLIILLAESQMIIILEEWQSLQSYVFKKSQFYTLCNDSQIKRTQRVDRHTSPWLNTSSHCSRSLDEAFLFTSCIPALELEYYPSALPSPVIKSKEKGPVPPKISCDGKGGDNWI